VKSTAPISAQPKGMPGCPELAACTPSALKPRMVLAIVLIMWLSVNASHLQGIRTIVAVLLFYLFYHSWVSLNYAPDILLP